MMTELTQLGSFLVDIRDKELALAKETAGSSKHTQLVSEKQTLETNMSLFVADKVHMDEFDMKRHINERRSITAFLISWRLMAVPGNKMSLNGLLSIVEVELDVIF